MDVLNFKKKNLTNLLLPILIASLSSTIGWSQQDTPDFTELDLIEAEIEKSKIQKSSDTFSDRDEKESEFDQKKPTVTMPMRNVSDLRQLEPFGDIAVIQPRYQPKSKRFQLNAGGSAILNDPWFNHFGLSMRASYHFTELLGIELASDIFSGSRSNAAKDLADNLAIQTSSLVQAKNYLGVHAYLAPIYGKMSLMNARIVPFDVFFTLGAGQTAIDGAKNQSAMTYHIGAGQIFAFSRNASFRWDIRVNMFEAQSLINSNKTSTQNVLMALGFSYFFPEVNLR